MSEFENYESDAAVAAALAERQAHLSVGHLTDGVALIDRNAIEIGLEQYQMGRSRVRGQFHSSDIDSFNNYVSNNAEPEEVRIFVDDAAMSAIAILNFKVEGHEQGHLDHKAILNAKKTVVFDTLHRRHMLGRVTQKTFAEFLEDWGHFVIARDSEGNVIANSRAVSAIRNMRIDESAQTDSHAGNYRESRSRLESVEAKSIDGALPAYFTVKDECYQGFTERNLKLRLSIGQDKGKPEFKLEIVSLQILEDELTKEFAAIVEESFEGACDVLIGSFQG